MNLIYVQQCLICCRFWRLWMVHGNKWTWELIVILFMLHCFLARFSFVLCPCFHALYVISLSSPHSLRLYDSFMAAHNPEKTDLWTTVIWMLVRCVSCLYPAFVAFPKVVRSRRVRVRIHYCTYWSKDGIWCMMANQVMFVDVNNHTHISSALLCPKSSCEFFGYQLCIYRLFTCLYSNLQPPPNVDFVTGGYESLTARMPKSKLLIYRVSWYSARSGETSSCRQRRT